jgi:hypothetical protein
MRDALGQVVALDQFHTRAINDLKERQNFIGAEAGTSRQRMLFRRHARLQLLEPVEDDVDVRGRRRVLTLDHQEATTVG